MKYTMLTAARDGETETVAQMLAECSPDNIVELLMSHYNPDEDDRLDDEDDRLDDQDLVGYTALMFAAETDNIEVAQLLLDRCPDQDKFKLINQSIPYGDDDKNVGYTALSFATKYNHANIVQLLLQYCANKNQKFLLLNRTVGYHQETPLLLAVRKGCDDVITVLLKDVQDVEKIILLSACNRNNKNAVQLSPLSDIKDITIPLLFNHCPPLYKFTFLSHAEEDDQNILFWAAHYADEALVSILLSIAATLTREEELEFLQQKDKHARTAFDIANDPLEGPSVRRNGHFVPMFDNKKEKKRIATAIQNAIQFNLLYRQALAAGTCPIIKDLPDIGPVDIIAKFLGYEGKLKHVLQYGREHRKMLADNLSYRSWPRGVFFNTLPTITTAGISSSTSQVTHHFDQEHERKEHKRKRSPSPSR